MYSDPMPETTPADRRRAVAAVFETPLQGMTMQRYYGPFKHFWARAAAAAAAFAMSATLLLALLGAVYSVSSAAVLADSPQARSAVAAAMRAATVSPGSTACDAWWPLPRHMTPARRNSPRSRHGNAARGGDARRTAVAAGRGGRTFPRRSGAGASRSPGLSTTTGRRRTGTCSVHEVAVLTRDT
jgi:hypothetical protein